MFCSSIELRSPYLARLPLIGRYFESQIPVSVGKIDFQKSKISEAQQPIKEAYQFIATHLHDEKITSLFQPALKDITSENLKDLIKPLVDLIEEEGLAGLKCLDLFSQENLNNLVKEAAKNVTDLKFLEDAIKFANQLPMDFKIDSSSIQRTTSTFKTFFRNILHLFQSTFRLDTQGTFMSIFNSNSLLEVYWKYLSIPVFMVLKLAEWLLDWTLAFLIVAIFHIVLGILLFVYNKFFNAPPSSLPRGENLNNKLLNGERLPVWENEPLLREFNEKLSGTLVPVITGPSGAGKSSLAQAFAQQQIKLQRQGLKYKTVYILKAPDLAKSYEGMADQLDYIHKMFMDHKSEAVIFLEEFDSALNHEDLWKLIFKYKDDHISCIPVTTKDGYEKAVEKAEFNTRYIKVEVDGKSTVEQVIRHHHRTHRHLGRVTLNENALAKLIEGDQQPSMGIGRLEEACRYVTNKKKLGTNADNIVKAEKELGLLKEKLASATSIEKDKLRKEIDEKEEELKKLHEKFTGILETAEKVAKLAQRCFDLREYEQKLARNIKDLIGQKKEQAIKEYTFISYHLLPELERRLDDLLKNEKPNKENYIPLQVDEALVEEAIKSMKN